MRSGWPPDSCLIDLRLVFYTPWLPSSPLPTLLLTLVPAYQGHQRPGPMATYQDPQSPYGVQQHGLDVIIAAAVMYVSPCVHGICSLYHDPHPPSPFSGFLGVL